MPVTRLLRGTAFGAIATALAVTSLPSSTAAAQANRDRYERVIPERVIERQVQRQTRSDDGASARQAAQEQRTQARQQAARQRQEQARSAQRERIQQRSDARAEAQQSDIRAAGDVGVERQRAQIERRVQERAARQVTGRDRQQGSTTSDRNRSYADADRNRTYRDARPDAGNSGVERQSDAIDRQLRARGIDRDTGEGEQRWRDRDDRYRDGWYRDDRYRDGRYYDGRYRDGHRHWDRRAWRSNDRYNWYRHRASNRGLYRLGRYYAPHRGYRYNRINIGFSIGRPFYGNRYWISDPWRYRLPEVYGPYRWVRYYDDVLLVDVYSGEVVDVIYDFFW